MLKQLIGKAFIRFKSDAEYNQITTTLSELGYECLYGGSLNDNIIIIQDGTYVVDYQIPSSIFRSCVEYGLFVDCISHVKSQEIGIKLFLEIAQMDLLNNNSLWYSYPNSLCGIGGQVVMSCYVKGCDIPKLPLIIQNHLNNRTSFISPYELAEAMEYNLIKL